MYPPSSLVARSSLLRGGARSALPSAATTTTTTTCRPTSSHLASNATAHDNVRDRRRSLGHRDATTTTTTTTTTIASLLAATAGGGALVREAADRRDGSGAAGGRAEAALCLCEPSKIGVATRRLTNRPGTIEVDAKRRMTRRRMIRRRREEETLGKESVVEARRESLAGDDIALSAPPSLVLQPMHDLVAGGIAGSVSVVVGRE
jgi:hypothetical protein